MRTTEKGETVDGPQHPDVDRMEKVPVPASKRSVEENGCAADELIENLGSLSISPKNAHNVCNGRDNVDELSRGLNAMRINRRSHKEPTENDDDEDEFISKGPPGEPSFHGDAYGNFQIDYNAMQYGTTPINNNNYYSSEPRRVGMKSHSNSSMVYEGVKAIHTNELAMSGGTMAPTPPASPEVVDSFASLEENLTMLAKQMEPKVNGVTPYVNPPEAVMSPAHSNAGMSPPYGDWETSRSPHVMYPLTPESAYSSVASPAASEVSEGGGFSPSRNNFTDGASLDAYDILGDIEEVIASDVLQKPSNKSDQSDMQQIKQIANQLQDRLSDQIVPSVPLPASLPQEQVPPTTSVYDLPSCAFDSQNSQCVPNGFSNQHADNQGFHTPASSAPPQLGYVSTTVPAAQFAPNNLSHIPTPSTPSSVLAPINTTAWVVPAPPTTTMFVNPATGQLIVVQSPQLPPGRQAKQRPIKSAVPRKILPKLTNTGDVNLAGVAPRQSLCKAVPIKESAILQRPLDLEKSILAKARAKMDRISDPKKFLRQDEDGDSDLMISVMNKKLELVNAIITRCKNMSDDLLKQVLDMQNLTMQTALYKALQSPDIMCMLLTYGADPTLQAHFMPARGSRDTEWRAPLHYCTYYGDELIDSTCLLLAAQKTHHERFIDAKSTESWTPLHYAALEHQREVQLPDGTTRRKDCTATIHTLIQEGANIMIKDERGGFTPMHYIVKTGDVTLVESVLDMLRPDQLQKALMQTASANEESCLHLAVQLKLPDDRKATMVQLLVDRCPDLMQLKMRQGNRTVTAQGLVQKGTKVWEVLNKPRNCQSRSPSHY